MFEAPLRCKFSELLTSKLWTIVADDCIWNTLSGEVTLEFLDHSAGPCVGEGIYFLKVGEVVNGDKVILAINHACTGLYRFSPMDVL